MSARRTGDPFYKTRRWRAVRAAVLADAGYLCSRCADGGRRTLARLVHHVTPRKAGGADYDRANLMALCVRCHDEIHAELDGAKADPGRAQWNHYLHAIMKDA